MLTRANIGSVMNKINDSRDIVISDKYVISFIKLCKYK